MQTELPVSVSIEVPPSATINDAIINLFKNLSDSVELLSIVSILFYCIIFNILLCIYMCVCILGIQRKKY